MTSQWRPLAELGEIAAVWDAMAEGAGTPFLTACWLQAWARSRNPAASVLLVREPDGSVLGGAALRHVRRGVASATDEHSGVWTALGRDDAALGEVWDAVAAQSRSRALLQALPERSAARARAAFEARGYQVLAREHPAGPRRRLPATRQELHASLSRGLRSQYGRRRRALEHVGPLELRTVTGYSSSDLETFFALESSGWKGRSGTAIRSSGSTVALYTGFAEAAAARGLLRLQLLEVGGRAVAGDLSCRFAGGIHMLKTGYLEAMADHSPGLVLRGMALEAAVDEGASYYDFLGSAEAYKTRWGGPPQMRMTLRAYRGPGGPLWKRYHRDLRPQLRRTWTGIVQRQDGPGGRAPAGTQERRAAE